MKSDLHRLDLRVDDQLDDGLVDRYILIVFALSLFLHIQEFQSGDSYCIFCQSEKGEIDIMESRGNDHLTTPDGEEIGANAMGTTLHWGPDWSANQYLKTTKAYHLPDGALYSADFHIWTLEWTPDGIHCSLGGHEYFTVLTEDGFWAKGEFDSDEPGRSNPWEYGPQNAPFDQKFYFLLNVAAGGTNNYFPEGSLSTPDGMSAYGMS